MDGWMGGWMGGWMDGWMDGATRNRSTNRLKHTGILIRKNLDPFCFLLSNM